MNLKKIFVLFFAFCISFSVSAAINTTDLVIIHTNDTHGHPIKFAQSPSTGSGGLPARATLVQDLKKQYQNVLVLDAGDINTGRPESNFFKAEPDIIGYNYIGYDAMVLGNHEFDNPKNVLDKQMKNANFPFLSANVKTKDGKLITKPYIIKTFKGFKVAIFGLTTKETATVGNPDIVKDLVFEDEVKVANELVPQLRKQADIVIALVHMGIYENENEGSKNLAKNVKGIDLIIDGHSHTSLEKPIIVNNIPIVQAWQWGLVAGEGILKMSGKKISGFEWKSVPINLQTKLKNAEGKDELKFIGNEIKEDEKLLAKLKPFADNVEKVLAEVIGSSDGVFSNKESRLKETEIGDLVADSMYWFTKKNGVDFALQNGGGIRTDLPQGEIKKKNIYEILPFDNSVTVVSLKGSDVKKIFDYIATIAQGKGAFPQVSDGVTFTINYEKGICENILIGGKPIDENKIYKIATNSFMATGGDGYEPFKSAVDIYETSMFQRDVFIDYFKNIGAKVKPENKNRIKIIGSKTAYIFGKNININS
jgi:5'-nucleotidase / UDP-sugar diphosphatase